MNCLRQSTSFFAASSLAFGAASIVAADTTLYSPDGRWSATIKDSGGGAGQCTQFKDASQPNQYQNSVTQTIHYLRLASQFAFAGATTARMEDTFHLVRFAHVGGEFSAVLAANSLSGVVAVIHGEMVSGDAGGLRISLAFADTTPTNQFLLTSVVKPFVYVNLNVDNQMLGNTGGWTTDHYHQSCPSTGTGTERWFLGRSPVSHASNLNSLMQDALDSGLTELNGVSSTGPGDINTAMSFASAALSTGVLHTIAYAIGNEGIAIPDDFGASPTYGAAGISSADGRWSATMRTGLGSTDFGTAGEITSVSDFNEPLSTAKFLNSSALYAAVGSSGVPESTLVSSNFSRLGFYLSTNTPRMFTAVLQSKLEPGLIAVIDGQMLSGNTGGLLTNVTFASTSASTVSVTPLISADMNVDNTVINLGAFDETHFLQKASFKGANNTRWFRSDTYSSYTSDEAFSLAFMLDLGINSLANTVESGPTNIATAFAYSPRLVSDDNPYVIAFAIGNEGIAIPSSFSVPTQPPICPADLNFDGFVNASDLAQLLGSWGPVLAGTAADLTGDGACDAADLAVLLGAWGFCDYPV